MIAHNEGVQDTDLNLDARLTISQLEMFFFGKVSRKCIDRWIRRGLLEPIGKNADGHVLVRLGDALDVEAQTWRSPRGRTRNTAA